jgi:hypothetical protein
MTVDRATKQWQVVEMIAYSGMFVVRNAHPTMPTG